MAADYSRHRITEAALLSHQINHRAGIKISPVAVTQFAFSVFDVSTPLHPEHFDGAGPVAVAVSNTYRYIGPRRALDRLALGDFLLAQFTSGLGFVYA